MLASLYLFVAREISRAESLILRSNVTILVFLHFLAAIKKAIITITAQMKTTTQMIMILVLGMLCSGPMDSDALIGQFNVSGGPHRFAFPRYDPFKKLPN